jgi:vacuolar-type H+-ATPase subunit E/Vma4
MWYVAPNGNSSLRRGLLHVYLPALLPSVFSCGGVVLTSADGRILCSNTLDHRVHIAYQANLPEIRKQLFGAA